MTRGQKTPTKPADSRRLRRLRAAIAEQPTVDGIHNADVRQLFERGGKCSRYLGCASEGSEQCSYRDNPDFFAGEAREVADWLARSYTEGWAGRWVLDLDQGTSMAWEVDVRLAVQESELKADPAAIGPEEALGELTRLKTMGKGETNSKPPQDQDWHFDTSSAFSLTPRSSPLWKNG